MLVHGLGTGSPPAQLMRLFKRKRKTSGPSPEPLSERVEAEEQDPSIIALANLELVRAEVRCGVTSAAIDRLITSIGTLRKHKHDTWATDALPNARKELGDLIKPSKRLRVKTLPEDC